ncbi:MAG: TetR/AcrR family transcriptional regulator [Cellulomonas sp.]
MSDAAQVGTTRERILAVALELFGRQGYAGTSIRDIADRMAMTKAAVYYHFPSKENLLADILDPAMTRVVGVLAAAGPVTTAAHRRALVTALVDVIGDVGPQVVVMLSDPAVGAHVRGLTGADALPQKVGAALLGPLPTDPREAADARLRAACAVACLPAGIVAWRREHPGASTLDDATKAVLVQVVLAVLDGPGANPMPLGGCGSTAAEGVSGSDGPAVA